MSCFTKTRWKYFSILNIAVNLCIILTGVTVGIVLYELIRSTTQYTRDTQIQQDASTSIYIISNILTRTVTIMSALVGTNNYTVSGEVIQFLSSTNLPDLFMLAPVVTNTSLDTWLQSARKIHGDDFNLKFAQPDYNPAEEGLDFYLPVELVSYSNGNRYLGLDLLSLPSFYTAVRRSFTNGLLGVYPNCEICGRNQIVFILPVASSTSPQPGGGGGAQLYNITKEMLQGVVATTLDLNSLEGIFNRSRSRVLLFDLTSGVLVKKDSHPQLDGIDTVEQAMRLDHNFAVQFPVGGSEWLVVTVPSNTYEWEDGRWVSVIALVLSILIAFLLLGFSVYYSRQQCMRERLLSRVFPARVSRKLAKHEKALITEARESVCILFTDIAGFTNYCSNKGAAEIVDLLNVLFSQFDIMATRYGVEKIKIIGDSYMCATGLSGDTTAEQNVCNMLYFAIDIMKYSQELLLKMGLNIRIGIHIGPVIAGVITPMLKPHFDIWGDTVNLASRMESNSLPGRVQVTEDVIGLANNVFTFDNRRIIDVKGKGPTITYMLSGLRDAHIQININNPSNNNNNNDEIPLTEILPTMPPTM